MRDVYTPGVARVCTVIAEEPALAGRYTMIGRTVAICTNGTRVLGLGNIGAVASMPVMEGKAMFYRQMAGISAIPILIDTEDADEFVETVVRIAPGFGAIHLEDIRAPDCFEIERAPDRGARHPGHARRRPRHRGRQPSPPRSSPATRSALELGERDRRPDRPRRRRPRHRDADGRGRRQAPSLASDPNEGSHAARRASAASRSCGFDDVMARGRHRRRHDRPARADQARAGPRRPGHPRAHQPRPRDRARAPRSRPAPRSPPTARWSTTCSASPASSAARSRPAPARSRPA